MARHLLVGVDGSASALHATRWAAEEAQRRGAGLRLLHACVFPPLVPRDDLYLEEVRQQGRTWLAEAESAAHAVAPDVPIDVSLVEGAASGRLVAESGQTGTDLVVLGSRGLGGFRSLLVGSVAVNLAAHGHCPVVVVRGHGQEQPPPSQGPVVVGVDGSPVSDAAVGFAFAAAASRGAELIAVHVWSDAVFDGAWASWPVVVDWAEVERDLRRLLDEQVSAWQDKHPDVVVHRTLSRGYPVPGLVAAAANAQLLVVGSSGRGAVTGLGGLGSTSQGLLHHAQCPVAVVRAGVTS